ncbi:MAG: hypothetical protein ACP5F9_09345 [Thiomonas sp.]
MSSTVQCRINKTEKIKAGHVFDLPPIACTGRLRDVLARMTDDELALQLGETAGQDRERWRVLAELARRRTGKGQPGAACMFFTILCKITITQTRKK